MHVRQAVRAVFSHAYYDIDRLSKPPPLLLKEMDELFYALFVYPFFSLASLLLPSLFWMIAHLQDYQEPFEGKTYEASESFVSANSGYHLLTNEGEMLTRAQLWETSWLLWILSLPWHTLLKWGEASSLSSSPDEWNLYTPVLFLASHRL